MKMSKSKPDSAIFMTDSAQEVGRKISKAYCPAKVVEENPVMEYNRHIIFEKFKEVKVERDKKFGGDASFASYSELEKAFVEGSLHPVDLKNTTAKYVNQLLEPARKHFSKGKPKELLEFIEKQEITR